LLRNAFALTGFREGLMNVPSPQFLAFALIAAVAYNLTSALLWRQAALLVVNVLFLASLSASIVALSPLVAFLVVGFFVYRITRNGHSPHLFVILLIAIILAFFWLKRYDFIPQATLLPFPYLLAGLSYIFFRVLHVIIDGHQSEFDEKVGLLSYINYTLNFTTFISGPIQRYEDYRRMEVSPAPLTLPVAGAALERIVLGYFKVAVVSMLLSLWQHQTIASLMAGGTLGARVVNGALLTAIYPIYLYFNFSGYVDVVIGVARYFRNVLPENFDHPFSSENFMTYWSRWHMTLSGWLKTYVYNPLMMVGMERVTAPLLAPYLAVSSYFVTFFLVGLWHGQTSEFIFYGITQGGGVALNKLYQIMMTKYWGRVRYGALCDNQIYRSLSRGLTFTWVAVTLLWFWSSWTQIGKFSAILGPLGVVLACLAILFTASLVLALAQTSRTRLLRVTWSIGAETPEPVFRSRYLRTVGTTALAFMTVVMIVILASPAPDIVYKTF
jgi:D-alanyl-lipoteichoic acid acyltransferase DltB (MBOAT superfamily)